jgi:hypothetical protein
LSTQRYDSIRPLILFTAATLLLGSCDVARALDAERLGASEFRKCARETKVARNECELGGCGNILASCYERQVAAIDSQTDSLLLQLGQTHCGSSARTLDQAFVELTSQLGQVRELNGEWSSFELKVDAAVMKNHALQSLARRCKVKLERSPK